MSTVVETEVEASARARRAADFFELTKPRLVLLVLLTTLVGYYVALTGPVSWTALLAALTGTTLCAAGSQALNQFIERETDALMFRTRTRPLPEGRVHPHEGLAFGVGLTVIGLAILWFATNPLAVELAALTVVTYLFLYTPLKSRTPLATMAGCVPGALPPVIGWTAAGQSIGVGGAALFAILFFWQVPHSLAIAYLYRSDYQRAGHQLLPVVEPDGKSTGRQILVNSLALFVVSLAPAIIGLAGRWYFVATVVTGLPVVAAGLRFARVANADTARAVLITSYLALTAQLTVLALDKTG
ncbi:MAG: protoheme IX farnesyltransferase [Deltaproteobacteria bacterium]|nr:protoheme IX farnesyltransferase [Deltaproteobacteria bacterium]